MKHSHAVSLAKRLLHSHIRMHSPKPATAPLNLEQMNWAVEILSTHLDACMRQRIHPDLSDAITEALDFALRHERAYEPIPHSLRWRSAFIIEAI